MCYADGFAIFFPFGQPPVMSRRNSQSNSRPRNPRSGGPSTGRRPDRKPAKPAGRASAASGRKRTRRASPAAGAPDRQAPQRLQRLLATAGFGSRRQCETLIEEGRVEIDGEIVSQLGTVVDPKVHKIRVDGVLLRQQKLVYYAVNKPTGFLSTNADPRGRQRVIDLVPDSERVFPVGRLDQSSQGLMLLTNDGDLAQQLAHPRFGVRKVYRVTVAGKIDPETMRNMRKGIYIAEGFVRVEGARILKSRSRATELEITLREGKNREIRRILARLGHKVQVLRRIAIGPLRLGDMPPGAYRPLTRDQVDRLRLAVEHSRDEVAAEQERPKRTPKPGAKRGKKTSKKRGHAESRSDVMAKRTGRKPSTTKVTFKPAKPKGGKVIGGD